MQAYSMDLRVRVMADVDQGLGTKVTAQKYRVSPDWVRKLKRFRRQTGSFAARQQRVSHATKLDDQLPRLKQLVQQQPDATLKELRDALGAQVALGTLWRALQRLQITFKKK
jgi:transposase